MRGLPRDEAKEGAAAHSSLSRGRTGKVSGRGAYICANAECLNRARKIKALERALEHGIEDEVFSRLASEITGDAE